MNMFRGNRRFFIILLPMLAGTFLLSKCNTSGKRADLQYADFAGSATCVSCHKDVYEKHLHTDHFHSLGLPLNNPALGSFEPGSNTYYFTPADAVTMEKRGDSLYQVEYIQGRERQKGRIDIVVGSGRKGQSYLFWKRNSLVQLPVTYFVADSAWSTSPGFNPIRPVFNRVITSRCLECHSTFFEKTSAEDKHPEEFDRNQVIYGVDCERCHGPAREHVTFHTAHPGETAAKYIVNPGKLPRQYQLDLCGLCHSGKLDKLKPSFSFRAGDQLTDFFSKPPPSSLSTGIDVHGNQLGLLEMSKCFTASEMTCNSCHSAHENEKGNLAVYSSRCMNCHNGTADHLCKMTATIGSAIQNNCIDCHMPLQQSQSIVVYLQGNEAPTPAKLRTHYIAVYKEESDKVLQFLKANAQKGK